MIDKVGQLLWEWFSCPRKLADKIVEPWHMAEFIICSFIRYQPASWIHNSRIQISKWQILSLRIERVLCWSLLAD